MTRGELTCTGLDGTNPMGFLAGLGVLSVCDRMMPKARPTLRWTVGFDVHAVLGGVGDLDAVVDAVMADLRVWRTSPALHFDAGDGPISDVKFASNDEVRAYLKACDEADDVGRSIGLATALVAEFVVDGQGKAKPTDLHFLAGRQLLLVAARKLIEPSVGVRADDVRSALSGPWRRASTLPSFMWDVNDDRVYALTGRNPAGITKLTEPGAELLALLGLACFPVQRVPGGRDRIRQPGSGGGWKRGSFSWPLWSDPATLRSARALIGTPSHRRAGVALRLESIILRSDQGGYGSFRPPSRVQL